MDAVVRAVVIYGFLLLLFRIIGRRCLAQITTFDLVLLLIISEATQNAMVGNDFSVTHGLVLILTLVGVDLVLSLAKSRSRRLDRWLEGLPLVIVEDGRPLRECMAKEHIDEEDILSAARELHGLERMDQIKYAVLERSGKITIIPRREEPSAGRAAA